MGACGFCWFGLELGGANKVDLRKVLEDLS